MARKYWKGGATAIAQVTTITWDAYTAGVTYTCTINGKDISYTAAASTQQDVIDGLVTAWQSSTDPEFAEMTPENDAGLKLTAVTPGNPFTVTAGSDGVPVATVTPTVAGTGPNHFSNADNWVGYVLPAAGDDVVYADGEVDCSYDIEQSGFDYGDIIVESTYTGRLGLPINNEAGYREYRPRFLKLQHSSAFNVTVGQGDGRQPILVRVDADTRVCNLEVFNSGSSSGDERPVIVKNMAATSSVDIYGGTVGLDEDTAAAQYSALRVTPQAGANVDVETGDLVSTGPVTIDGGTLDIRGTAIDIKAADGAQVTVSGTATGTVSVSDGATIFWANATAFPTGIINNGGSIDFSVNGATKTCASMTVTEGATLNDPLGIVTYTAGISLGSARLGETTIDVGRNRTLSIT